MFWKKYFSKFKKQLLLFLSQFSNILFRFRNRRRKVVYLKEKTLKIEISFSKIKRFFLTSRLRWLFFLLLFVVSAAAIWHSFMVRAEIVDFYPLVCLGGWENPQNAQGKPDLEEGALAGEFNEENSAVLRNVIAQIFCSGFSGEIKENTKPLQFTLKFSWEMKDDEVINLFGVSPEEKEQNQQPATEEQKPTTDNIDTETGAEEISWRQKLVNFVLASGETEKTKEIKRIEETETIIKEKKDITPNAFLEVFYTLDSLNWNSLGKINKENYKNISFVIPLENWKDVEKFQVSIQSLLTLEEQPEVYLDGMILEVAYEFIPEEELSLEEIKKLPRIKIEKEKVFKLLKKDFQANEEPEFEIDLDSLEAEYQKIEREETIIPTEETLIEESPSAEVSPKEILPEEGEESAPEPAPASTPTEKNENSNPSFFLDTFQKLNRVEKVFAKTKTPKIIRIEVLDPQLKEIQIEPALQYLDESFKINLPKPAGSFLPGKYQLTVEILYEKTVFVMTQDFTWGVLAINTNKSIYLPNETAYLQMAVLRDDGHTICNANLELRIWNLESKIETILSTKDGTIQYSDECGPNNVTDKPDYFAYYRVGEAGVYQMKLTNLDNGYEIEDSFEVRESVPFEVERIGPTRIYPPATYEMKFRIKANQDFTGQVIEKVPESFEIVPHESIQIGTKINTKEIIWQVDWKAGENYELKYQFDAPDISPYLYLLGPLSFQGETPVTNLIEKIKDLFIFNQLSFQETRQWQIAADNIDPGQLEYWISVGPFTGTTTSPYTYVAAFNPAGSGRTAVVKRIFIQADANAAAAWQDLNLYRISASTGGTLISAADVPKKNTFSANTILEIRHTNPTVTLVGTTDSRLMAVSAPGAAGATYGRKEIVFGPNDEKLILQPGQGIALRQIAAGSTAQLIRLSLEWEEVASPPASEGEYLFAYPKIEVNATANYVYNSFFNPAGSGRTAVVKRISVDIDADAAITGGYINWAVRRITAASAGTQIAVGNIPKKHTATPDTVMDIRHSNVTVTIDGSVEQFISLMGPGAANQPQSHYEINFQSGDEKIILQPGQGIAFRIEAGGDVDYLPRMTIEWKEETTAPSSQGEYLMAIGPVSGAGTANANYISLFNPAGSGRTAVVKRMALRVDAAAGAVYIPIFVQRISAASGGTLISAANVPKKHTGTANSAVEIRTGPTTITLVGTDGVAALMRIVSPGAVAQIIGHKEVVFGTNEKLVLQPGEGIVVRSGGTDSTGHRVRFLVEWAEPTSAPSSQGEYLLTAGPVSGSTSASYNYISFFNPSLSGKTAIVKRVAIRVDTVGAANYTNWTLRRISAASGGTQIVATNIPKKHTNTVDSVLEVRHTNPSVTYSGTTDSRLASTRGPGAIGAATAPHLTGYQEIVFTDSEPIILQPNQGFALYHEAAANANHRVNLLVEWDEETSAPTSEGEYLWQSPSVTGSTTSGYVYATIFNTSNRQYVVRRVEVRAVRTGTLTTPGYIPISILRIGSASGGTQIAVENIPKKHTGTSNTTAEIRHTNVTVTGTASQSYIGVTAPGAVGDVSGIYNATTILADELVLDSGQGLALIQQATAGDTNLGYSFSISWKEFLPTITVSGNAYEDETNTVWSGCDNSTNRISLRVEGVTYGPVSCASNDGAFSFSGIPRPFLSGTPMVIWFDGVTNNFGSNVNRYSGSGNVTGIAVRRNRVTVQHDDAGPVTNANLGIWDNDNDADINYDVDVSNNLVVEAGSKIVVPIEKTFTPGANVTTPAMRIVGTYSAGSHVLALNAGGTSTTCTDAAGTVMPLCIDGGTFTAGTSTVNFIGDGDTRIAATTYNNLTFSPTITAGRTYTTGGAITVNSTFNSNPSAVSALTLTTTLGGALTVGTGTTGSITLQGAGAGPANSTLNTSGSNYAVSTATLSIAAASSLTANGSTITIRGNSGTPFTITGTFTPGTSTVIFNGDGNITIAATTYNNLTFSPTITAGRTYTTGGAIIINSNLDINPSGSANSLIFNLGGETIVNGSTTIRSTGGSANSILNTTVSNYNLTSGTINIQNSGTLTANNSTITLTGTGTPLTIAGTFIYNTSIVSYTGNGAILTALSGTGGSNGYYNLEAKPSGDTAQILASGTFAINNNFVVGDGTNAGVTASVNNPTINVTGNFSISANATFTAPGPAGALNVKGNWTNSGNFTANFGTVTLNGTSTQTLSGTMTGTSAFYNLTITNNSGASPSDCERAGFIPSIDFNAAATVSNNYTITTANVRVEYESGALYTFQNNNWQGASGNLIFFRNSLSGTGNWLLNVPGSQTITYLNVSRSNASGYSEINATGVGNVDCGNNINWNFFTPSISYWLSANSLNLGNLNPWNVVQANHTVTVTTNAPNGYILYISEDGNLRKNETVYIQDVEEGQPINAGTEAYGLNTGYGQFATNYSPITGEMKILREKNAPATNEETTCTYKAAVSPLTPQGYYSHIITIVVVGKF